MTRAFQLLDPIGTPSAPLDTWAAIQTRFGGSDLTGGRLILVTDRQGERASARYAAVFTLPGVVVVSAPAFGPRYGQAGEDTLRALLAWAVDAGLPVRETVLGGAEFNRVLEEPQEAEVQRLIAASTPSDPGIYTTRKNVEAGL